MHIDIDIDFEAEVDIDIYRRWRNLCTAAYSLRSPSPHPPFPPLMSSCPPHTCMRAVTHLHTHTRTVRPNGPVAGVREKARGGGGGADGGDQARGRPGPAGRARGVAGSVHGVRSADKERGGGRARNWVVVLGMHYWDQVISSREEGHGGAGH